ncbi:MAG: hypothetical protein QF358_12935, partial [Arenicellales bacterium]|nr:hypothetical protein [Arenicellales bacterium]
RSTHNPNRDFASVRYQNLVNLFHNPGRTGKSTATQARLVVERCSGDRFYRRLPKSPVAPIRTMFYGGHKQFNVGSDS